jgi:hypothetical protein
MIITGKINSIMRQALEFYACRLFTHQLSRHIEVKVTQRKHMPEFHGLCGIEDYNVLGQPRYFEIEIRASDTQKEKLITLAHEMVHVRQYCRNELNEQGNKWCGRRIDVDNIPWNELPWEIEANELGYQLYKEFTECHKKK